MDQGPELSLMGFPACHGLQNQQVYSFPELVVQWVQGHYRIEGDCF